MNNPARQHDSTLLDTFSSAEDTRTHWMLRFAFLLAPVGVTIALMVLIVLWRDARALYNILGIATFALFMGGKFTILLSEPLGGFPVVAGWTVRLFDPYWRAALITYMDIVTGVILVFNVRHAYRLPKCGPWMEEFHRMANEMLRQHPWIRRLTFLGVVLFVMFPLTGTGAIGGTIFGRLMGLHPYTVLLGIACGAFLGCFGMAAFAGTINRFFPPEIRDSWEFSAANIAILALLVFLAARFYRVLQRRYGAGLSVSPDEPVAPGAR